MAQGKLSRIAGRSLKMFGLPICDPTNSFKLYRTERLQKLELESAGGFEINLEIVGKAFAQDGASLKFLLDGRTAPGANPSSSCGAGCRATFDGTATRSLVLQHRAARRVAGDPPERSMLRRRRRAG